MPGPQPERIELSDKARQDLEKLVARHTTGQQTAQRAQIILKAAERLTRVFFSFLGLPHIALVG